MSKETNIEQVVASLNKIATQLQALAVSLQSETVTEPPETSRKKKAGLCVKCGLRLKRGKSKIRGCHVHCYQEIRRAIDRGDFTDDFAVLQGKIGLPEKRGRKRQSEVVQELKEKFETTNPAESKKVKETADEVLAKLNKDRGDNQSVK